jgi:hypothetical protein
MGVLKKSKGFLAYDGLRLFIGRGMTFEWEHFYKKDNILSLFYDLLHLLMKFGAVGSVGIIESDYPDFRLWIPHHKGIFQRNLRHVHPVQFAQSLLGQVFLLPDGEQRP